MVDGIATREYPGTYFIDVVPQERDALFNNKGLDAQFYWTKNTMVVALQMLMWMGFSHIGFSGIDLHGSYFDGRELSLKFKADTELLLREEYEFMRWFVPEAQKRGMTLENHSSSSRLKDLMS
jgi:hypothetical protein